MNTYVDSNFFTRIYIETEWMQEVLFTLGELMSSGVRLPVLWLPRVEVRNAFELFVFPGKPERGTRVAPEEAAAAWARFRADYCSRSGPFRESLLSLDAWEHAAEELWPHTQRPINGCKELPVIFGESAIRRQPW